MSEQKQIYFVKINGQDAMSTRDACQYLGRSYFTLRNLLARNPGIKKYLAGEGNKQFLLKQDVDKLKAEIEKGIVVDENKPAEEGFQWIDIDGQPALNLQQSAGYLGISYSALQKKLKKYPQVRKRMRGADSRDKYLLKEDLDMMNKFQVEE